MGPQGPRGTGNCIDHRRQLYCNPSGLLAVVLLTSLFGRKDQVTLGAAVKHAFLHDHLAALPQLAPKGPD